MTRPWLPLFVFELTVLCGCLGSAFNTFTPLPLGSRVPVAELELHGGALRAFVLREIDNHRYARAYFALDLLKTRPYAEQQLGSSHGTRDLRDLRSMAGPLRSADHDRRGLAIVKRPGQQRSTSFPGHVYWNHVRLFERRVGVLHKETPGLPYSYAARKAYGVTSVEETHLIFSADEAFLSFVVHGERAFGFLITGGRLVVRPLPWSSDRLRRALRHLHDQVRVPPAPGAFAAWMADAAALHDAILGPFTNELRDPGLRALFVSPDDFLGNLPFALLLEPDGRGRRPVVERLRIIYLPSVSVYRQLLDRPVLNEPPRVLAVANAIYPSEVDPLPFAEREAATVSELFPGSTLLAGAAATEERVVALAPRHNILHLATHGILLDDLGPGASSLLVTPDARHDGFLSAAEIASLDLSHTYIAVLSACNTATVAERGPTDLGNLMSAFLGAGSPSVIGSSWQVEDQATTLLMLGFYKRFLEVGAAEALRQAMLELRMDRRFAHPFYWAPFALYGWDK
jgi:CHAT domain-containing protein